MLLIYRNNLGPPAAAIGARIAEIPTALLGTSLKVLVLVGGQIKERATTEGVPLVMVNGEIRELLASETLQS